MLNINGKEEVEDPGVRKPILEGLVVERECDRERLKIYNIKKKTRSFRRFSGSTTKTSPLFFSFLNTFFLEMLPLASGGGLDTPVHVVQ